MAQAGWYPDARDPELRHYFDGRGWSEPEAPDDTNGQPSGEDLGPGLLGDPALAAPPRRRRGLLVPMAATAVVLTAGLVTWAVWPDDRPAVDRPAPRPPAAAHDVLTTAALPASSAPGRSARLVGRNVGVTIGRIHVLDSYGTGAGARSAPPGERLVGFTLAYGAGAIDGSAASATTVRLVTTDADPRSIPRVESGRMVVAAVPVDGAAYVALTDGNLTQSIALPSGRPADDVVSVTQRRQTAATVNEKATIGLTVTRGGTPKSATATVLAASAALAFWLPATTDVRPSDVRTAYLYVNLAVSVTGLGSGYTLEASQLTLRVGERRYSARTIPVTSASGTAATYRVFLVPASFTSGVLELSGVASGSGVTSRITRAGSIQIDIPAG